jgi:hypothetical protein
VRKSILVLAAAMVLTSAAPGNAELLTFNDIPATESPVTSSLAYGGFTFSSSHFHTYGCGHLMYPLAQNASTHLSFEADRGGPITMARENGSAFSLASIDVAEMYNTAYLYHPNAELLRISGVTSGSTAVSYSLYLDGVNDGFDGLNQYGAEDFQHFVLPAVFDDLVSVTFSGWRLDGGSGSVALDNIEFELAPIGPAEPAGQVPEPASLALFGLGLLGFTATRRRSGR